MGVVIARMREDAVTITFRRIGKFFNKVRIGGFSFPAMICRYTSHRKRRYQSAAPRYPSFSRFKIASSRKSNSLPDISLKDFAHANDASLPVNDIEVAISKAAATMLFQHFRSLFGPPKQHEGASLAR